MAHSGEPIDIILYGTPENIDLMAGILARTSLVRVHASIFGPGGLNAVTGEPKIDVAVTCFARADRDTTEFIPAAKNQGILVVAVCHNAIESFDMLSAGASEMCILSGNEDYRDTFVQVLVHKINELYRLHGALDTRAFKSGSGTSKAFSTKVVAFGSSTGGTEALSYIINRFPGGMPPIVIVQHMPPVFTKLYAERLYNSSALTVWEARDGDELRPGLALVAPGDYQMEVCERGGKLYVSCKKGERVNGHIPSVDVLFQSVARVAGAAAIGVLLTGMGADGANGLLDMRNSGAYTVGQDEASSVVYGMPKVAYEIGAVTVQAHRDDIAGIIVNKIFTNR